MYRIILRGTLETDRGHEKIIQTLKGSTLPAVSMQPPKGRQVTGQKESFDQVSKSPKFKTQKGRRQIQEIQIQIQIHRRTEVQISEAL